jgi:hypothetical protein
MYLEADHKLMVQYKEQIMSSTLTHLHAALQNGQVVRKNQIQVHITLCRLLLTDQKHSSSQNT